MRTTILQILRKTSGQYVSGEEISKQVAVSRTAIWKHIQALKEEGYEIEAYPRRGYCLKQAPDLLLPEEIRARLTTQFVGREIYYAAQVDSTNNEAKKQAANGCPAGTIVLAEEQLIGRGRLARGWFSPSGKGIWLSIVLRPPFMPYDAPKCTLLAAVAITKAIRKTTGVECGIKWPNDILYQGKKLVGILTEMSAEMDAINYVVIGAGINVNIAHQEFPVELGDCATSLAEITQSPVARMELLISILAELEAAYYTVINEGFEKILAEWRTLSITLGQEVAVVGVRRQFTGIALDIDSEGALLVETSGGIEKVLAGDVSIRPKSSA